jgi:type II secretory pathway component PulF
MAVSMLFSPRMPLKPLAALCRRVAIALLAGIDLRTVCAREAQQARARAARQRLAAVSRAINQGKSLTNALLLTGDFFPALFREMVEVGEQSGHLGEVFSQLAEHYEGQVGLRRSFLAAIAWPVLQLAAALAIIGFLIWIMGFVGQFTGTTIDTLGFGLVGNRGLAIYSAVLVAAGALLFVCIRAASRGAVWTRPVQRGVLRLPVLGPALALCVPKESFRQNDRMTQRPLARVVRRLDPSVAQERPQPLAVLVQFAARTRVALCANTSRTSFTSLR